MRNRDSHLKWVEILKGNNSHSLSYSKLLNKATTMDVITSDEPTRTLGSVFFGKFVVLFA